MTEFLIVAGFLAICIVYPTTTWFRFEHALYFLILGVIMVIVGLLMLLGRAMACDLLCI